MIIAIDGPAGAGKSTISKLVCKKLGIIHIDTGGMYRAATYYFLKNGVDIRDLKTIESALKEIHIDFQENRIYLNGEDVSQEIRTQEVNDKVSEVAALSLVRKKMVDLQRQMSQKKSVLLDGRDIGTVVFPKADFKFYLNASVEERTKRRFLEEKERGVHVVDIQEIQKSIEKRDYMDSHREISPLKKAQDAVEIDTTGKDINQVVNEILDLIGEINVI